MDYVLVMKQSTPRGLLDTLRIVASAPDATLPSVAAGLAPEVRRLQALTRLRNVVGVGISEKTAGDETTGELSLCFYVVKKRPQKHLRREQIIPPLVRARGNRTYRTDVKEIGDCRPHSTALTSIRSGESVSHAVSRAGTIGAIVTRADRLFILSNSHVLARSGKAKIGDAVLSPGLTDGGQMPADLVARLAAFVPFDKDGDNRVDAAIAEIAAPAAARIRTAIPGAALPPRTELVDRGMHVEKTGRTTQRTTSHVIDAHFRVTLPYPNGMGLLRFVDQILCEAFAAPGDSGALVTSVDSRRVVGLHFAGSSVVSICNPINQVMTALSVTFAS